jgi:transcriptional regulator with XRE-family HTH domain
VRLRHDQRCPRRTLAERAGLGDATLDNWEKGRRQPGLFAFNDTLQVLGYKLLIVHDDFVKPSDFKPTAPPKPPEWIGTTAAASLIGVTPQAVHGAVKRGQILAKRQARRWLVNRASALAYKRHEKPETTDAGNASYAEGSC